MALRLVFIFSFLCCCSSDEILTLPSPSPTSSSESQSFASSSELSNGIIGGYYRNLGGGVSDSWRFRADGTFEREVVTTAGISSNHCVWSVAEGGILRIGSFDYSMLTGTVPAGQDAGGSPVWFRVRIDSENATFVSTGGSLVQVSFSDYERRP